VSLATETTAIKETILLTDPSPWIKVCFQNGTENYNRFSIINKSSTCVNVQMVEISGFRALIMEATSISETSVNLYQTSLRNNPAGSHFHTGGS
jgi:hypothetical protein